MKISNLHESGPEERARMHHRLTMQYLSPEEKQIIKKVHQRIMAGKSQLKPVLASNEVTIFDVIYAIKNNRCIPAHDRDMGSTYLESVIGNSITDIFKGKMVNIARRVFGMHAIDVRQEKKEITKNKTPQANVPKS